jgi:GT2 family glycosyltransferase
VQPVTSFSLVGQSGLPAVFVIVLNWNGWRDTVECLESLFRLDYPDYRIIVVDNGSTDGSVEHICAWADGTEPLEVEVPEPLHRLVQPPVAKPLTWRVLDVAAARVFAAQTDGSSLPELALTIIQTGADLGYAGGNNVGIRFALAIGCDAVWILNNDTVVEPGSLTHLVERLTRDECTGIVGSTVLYYDRPGVVQCLAGASYQPEGGRQLLVGQNEEWPQAVDVADIEQRLSLVSGAAVLVSAKCLKDVGLMSEEYFLFYEEADWAERARRHYTLGYAPGSVVYHKEGRASGSKSLGLRSPVAEYWLARSQMLFTRRYYPRLLSSVVWSRFRDSLYYIVRKGAWRNAGGAWRGMAAGLSAKLTTDILYLMYIPWQWVRQRPQYMAEALRDKGFRVTVVSPLVWRKEVLAGGQAFDGPQVNYRFLPFRFRSATMYSINRVAMRQKFASILKRSPYAVLWVPFPELMDYLPDRLNGIVVYDCMDDALAFDQLAPVRERLQKLEQRLVARADVILTSSASIANKLADRYGTSEKVCIVHNAFGGLQHASTPSVPEPPRSGVRALYYGGTAVLDWSALRHASECIPGLFITVVGPRDSAQGDTPVHKRFLVVGSVPHEKLPELVSQADVLLIPFALSELMLSVDPVKLYEYVYFGKPIVSVWYPEIARFEPFVEFYRTADELVEVLKRVSTEGYCRKYTERQRLQFLAENSWDRRAEAVRDILRGLLSDGEHQWETISLY